MKVGLFFGSFNPLHQGHLAIASYFVEHSPIDKLWFVVSPQNPLKSKTNLLSEQDRLEMVEIATKDDFRFEASDVEFKMPRPSYTIDTLVRLNERHPDTDFFLIMGADTLKTLHKWKNHEMLLNHYDILVYPRHGSAARAWTDYDNIHIVQAPRMEISARFIRESIQAGKSIKYFVPESVREYIDKWGLFLK